MNLIGAGGHCKVVLEILERSGVTSFAIFDRNGSIKELCGYSVTDDLSSIASVSDHLIITVGDNFLRCRLAHQLRAQFHLIQFGFAVHPSAEISSRASVKEGTIIMSNVAVNSSTIIGAHCILNTNSSIDHDCVIEDFVHISPNAALAGGVSVGEGTHVGIGACVIPGVKIGKWCTIGAGAVIIKDVPDFSVVVGNPGRIISSNKDKYSFEI